MTRMSMALHKSNSNKKSNKKSDKKSDKSNKSNRSRSVIMNSCQRQRRRISESHGFAKLIQLLYGSCYGCFCFCCYCCCWLMTMQCCVTHVAAEYTGNPIPFCFDSPSLMFMDLTGKNTSCAWLAANPEVTPVFCDDVVSNAASICPLTCGTCDTYTPACAQSDDDNTVFALQGTNRTCNWLREQITEQDDFLRPLACRDTTAAAAAATATNTSNNATSTETSTTTTTGPAWDICRTTCRNCDLIYVNKTPQTQTPSPTPSPTHIATTVSTTTTSNTDAPPAFTQVPLDVPFHVSPFMPSSPLPPVVFAPLAAPTLSVSRRDPTAEPSTSSPMEMMASPAPFPPAPSTPAAVAASPTTFKPTVNRLSTPTAPFDFVWIDLTTETPTSTTTATNTLGQTPTSYPTIRQTSRETTNSSPSLDSSTSPLATTPSSMAPSDFQLPEQNLTLSDDGLGLAIMVLGRTAPMDESSTNAWESITSKHIGKAVVNALGGASEIASLKVGVQFVEQVSGLSNNNDNENNNAVVVSSDIWGRSLRNHHTPNRRHLDTSTTTTSTILDTATDSLTIYFNVDLLLRSNITEYNQNVGTYVRQAFASLEDQQSYIVDLRLSQEPAFNETVTVQIVVSTNNNDNNNNDGNDDDNNNDTDGTQSSIDSAPSKNNNNNNNIVLITSLLIGLAVTIIGGFFLLRRWIHRRRLRQQLHATAAPTNTDNYQQHQHHIYGNSIDSFSPKRHYSQNSNHNFGIGGGAIPHMGIIIPTTSAGHEHHNHQQQQQYHHQLPYPNELDVDDDSDISTLGDPLPPGMTRQQETDGSTVGPSSMTYDFRKAYGSSVASSSGEGGGGGDGGSSHNMTTLTDDDGTLGAQYLEDIQYHVEAPPGLLGLLLERSSTSTSNNNGGKQVDETSPPTTTTNTSGPMTNTTTNSTTTTTTTTTHHIVVHAIKEDSVLAQVVQVGDHLLTVDGMDVTLMLATDVSHLIAEKRDKPIRRFVFSRPQHPTITVRTSAGTVAASSNNDRGASQCHNGSTTNTTTTTGNGTTPGKTNVMTDAMTDAVTVSSNPTTPSETTSMTSNNNSSNHFHSY